MTYGYSDFVSPKRIEWLREQGILGRLIALNGRPFESLRTHERREQDEQREVEEWAPELKQTWSGKSVFVTWQLFPVLPPRGSNTERMNGE